MQWSQSPMAVSCHQCIIHHTHHRQTSHSASRGITPLSWELWDHQWSIIRELMVAAEILAAHGLCNLISYLAASLHISHCRAEEAVREGNIAPIGLGGNIWWITPYPVLSICCVMQLYHLAIIQIEYLLEMQIIWHPSHLMWPASANLTH